MTFTEYLNTDIDNSDLIFEYYLQYLSNLSSKDFPYEEQIQLKATSVKFMNCIENLTYIIKEKKEKYFELINQIIEDVKIHRRRKDKSKILLFLLAKNGNIIPKIKDDFEEVYSQTLEFIGEASNIRHYRYDNLKLDGFFQPENSNKHQVKQLILEAIELIEKDNTISEKVKKQIIEYLQRVIKKLDNEYINWSSVIGCIKETIIVLGALGGFVGGMTPLVLAKDKLEETSTVIEKTSININYKTINETFNIQNVERLEQLNGTVFQLNQNNPKVPEE
ncbi:hypothetical protein DI487_15410 [Flavobacterium sediminis]|uniref:Uncharacterized protein n=1 Tax=Flavobacterium sediminis TaxID=2201181 RepID=A0A2U8QYG4_9FLAO|nr:hypothetical protein [Flavobacterium sediminis]AWM15101.1 hypothetical protein DI487_15410 [Flavobacterium sediminis]